MAVTVNSEMPSGAGVNLTTSGSPATATQSFTNTSGGYLLVGVNFHTNSGTVSGVTYGGAAMTLVSSQRSHTGGVGAWLYLYELLAPATGANDIVVTTDTAGRNVLLGAVSLTGNHTTTPRAQAAVAACGESDTVSCDVTGTTTNNLIVAVMCAGLAFTTTINTSTYLLNHSGSNYADNCRGVYAASTGGTVTMGSSTSADGWAIIALEVAAAPAGGPSSVPLFIRRRRW